MQGWDRAAEGAILLQWSRLTREAEMTTNRAWSGPIDLDEPIGDISQYSDFIHNANPMTERPKPRAAASAPSATETPPTRATVTVTATDAQSHFGRVFERAIRDEVVVITRHNAPRAVLLSIDRYNELVRAGESALDSLTAEFDALLDRLQSPGARAALQQAFAYPPDELARAAVSDAARRHRDR